MYRIDRPTDSVLPPYFDANPAFSPNGKMLAFDSDRDGSEGNIFTLDLATKEVKQVSHEDWADRPTWSPDGRSVIYLHLIAKDRRPTFEGPMGPYQVGHRAPAKILKVAIAGGPTGRLRSPDNIWSCFYLPSSDLAWTIVDIQQPDRVVSRVETVDQAGKVTSGHWKRAVADHRRFEKDALATLIFCISIYCTKKGPRPATRPFGLSNDCGCKQRPYLCAGY